MATAAWAQPPQGPPPGAPPGPPGPPPWWEHNGFADGTPPEAIRTHIEASASLMSARGNSDGEAFDGRFGLIVRKHLLTSRFDAELSKRDLTYGAGGGQAQFTQRTVREQVDFAVSKRVTAVAGIEDHRNTLMFTDDRLTFYAGGGATLLEDARQKVDLLAGIGHVSFTFDRDAVARVAPGALSAVPTTSPASGAALVIESWRFTFPNKMTLMQDGSYRKYFDEHLGHLWTLSATLNMPVSAHVSVVPAYAVKDEQSTYTQALHVLPQDRTLTIGLRVSY
jgi:hypothetical protein